ncbi:MAG: hypothetical protein ACRDH9_09530 [Actinomycetota bacterium]
MRGSDTPFGSVLALVDQAKRELVSATPSPRGFQAVSLADALLRFEKLLRDASEQMLGMQLPGNEILRDKCSGAIEESLRRAETLRLEAPATDYEGLVGALGDLLDPLDVFLEAEHLAGSS